MSKPGLFDYVNEINHGKQNLASLSPEGYNAFMVNRALSQHHETVIPAQVMNYYHELDKDMQMEYLIQSIPKKKRFAKWEKVEKSQYLNDVIEHYQVNRYKAMEIIDLMDSDELESLHQMLKDTGGLVK